MCFCSVVSGTIWLGEGGVAWRGVEKTCGYGLSRSSPTGKAELRLLRHPRLEKRCSLVDALR